MSDPTAARWQSRPVATPWCPVELLDSLPWGHTLEYADLVAFEERVNRAERAGDAWHLLALSMRGRVHAHDGTHREDAVALRASGRGFAMAAADGAGSSRWSRVGAACVCREIASGAEALLRRTHGEGEAPSDDDLRATVVDAVSRASTSLHLAATAAGTTGRDFRTTALGVLGIDDRLATLQVGDGAIVALSSDGVLRRLGVADAGEYSGEVSAFIPEVDRDALLARVAITPLEALDAILVVTDGIEDPFYPFERRGQEVLRQLYEGVSDPADGFAVQRQHGPVVDHPEALVRLAEWMSFERRGENDDRTLAGAFRLPPRHAR